MKWKELKTTRMRKWNWNKLLLHRAASESLVFVSYIERWWSFPWLDEIKFSCFLLLNFMFSRFRVLSSTSSQLSNHPTISILVSTFDAHNFPDVKLKTFPSKTFAFLPQDRPTKILQSGGKSSSIGRQTQDDDERLLRVKNNFLDESELLLEL